jgi:AmmeMemoRadiSam system protein B
MAVTRPAAVAGRWYPGVADVLAPEVDHYLSAVQADGPEATEWSGLTDLTALVAPHAGLRYSGPVAAWAYRALQGRALDVVVVVGPSHFIEFEGVAASRADAFETPFGLVTVDEASVAALAAASPLICEHEAAHAREHSIEMQLPFLCRVRPHVPIVPLLIGRQTADTAAELGRVLAETFAGRRVMLIASTDLSHYNDAHTAAALDRAVIERVEAFDPDALQEELDRRPDHACGGGAFVTVMRAARLLGANRAQILQYADSGDVSGDKSSVVGYLAAAFRRVSPDDSTPPHAT